MAASRHDYPDPTYEEVREALSYIPTPPSHDEWYPMAFAIKDALGENGFELWDEWSRQGEGYNSSITKSTWKSATPKAGGITVATLFKLARDNGYRPDKPYTPPTAEQLAAREAEQRARAEAAAEEQAERHAQAAKRAYGIWKNADITVDLSHGYLQKKGIADADLVRNIRQNEYQGQKQLVIPLWQNSKLVSVQTINENGGKHFLKGGQKSGSYAVLGNLDKEAHKGIAVAEGFATAASIRKATGLPVVIAFDGGNMVRIAENMAQRLSENQTVILAADNDPSGGGLAAATNAAVALGSRARIVMPEFSPEMVQRYQTEFGGWNDSKNRENLPSDFNDLHYLAGLERVRADFAEVMERLPENVPTAEPLRVSDDATIDVPVREWRKSERAPWRNFPPVIRNGGLGDLKNEPEYTAAKSGSNAEAVHLVNRLLTDETVQLFREMAGDRDPLIVSVLATEALGNNKIPLAMAQALGSRLGLQVDISIRQINKVSRTGAGIDHRFAFQPVFDGTVEAGRDYLIVDDTLSVGGTIAALRGYIENRGGRVIGAGVMTAHEGALTLPVKQTMIDGITRKHGDAMNNYWTKEFGYGIDHLTQGEAGHLRAAENVEQLRDRINDARLRGITGRNEQPQPLSSGQQEHPKALKPEIHTTAATEQEAAVLHSQQEQNMAQQPTDISYSADNPYAPYAAHDDEVRRNADDWEMRVPLTETMLAGFNSKAEANGFAVYIEDRHASLGRFQAGKSTENGAYRVEIDGAFKNHGSMSVQEAARDFTVSFHDGDEIVGYAYGNDFDALLKQADEWLQTRQQEQITDYTQPINGQSEPATSDQAAVSISKTSETQTVGQPETLRPHYSEQIITQLAEQYGWTVHDTQFASKTYTGVNPTGGELNPNGNLTVYARFDENSRYLSLERGWDSVFDIDARDVPPSVAAQVFNRFAEQAASHIPVERSDVATVIRQETWKYYISQDLQHQGYQPEADNSVWEKTIGDDTVRVALSSDQVTVSYVSPNAKSTQDFLLDEERSIIMDGVRQYERLAQSQPKYQQENKMAQPEILFALGTPEAETEYYAINLINTTAMRLHSTDINDVAQSLRDGLNETKEELHRTTDAAELKDLQYSVEINEKALSLLQQGLKPYLPESELPRNPNQQETDMNQSESQEAENSIEYGGRSQIQDSGTPERETITLEEVQANLQRSRVREQMQAATASQTTVTDAEKSGRPSENTSPTPANPLTDGQETEHGHSPFPKSKPVLDLSYATAVGLSGRYVRMQGKYLDINNAETVMFEDKGAKIKTAKNDPQTVSDMLDTAQAKNWDSINISGSRDFRRQMWLEAELRGIASTGYKPNKEDLALRDQLRESRERNSIEARNRPEQTKTETVRTDISNSDAQKQEPAAVTESPVLPDKTARFRAEAETLKMQADTPAETVEANQAETFVAQTANKQHGMPKPVTDTAKHKTQSVAVNHELEAAKAAYLSKADKLSKAAKNRLADHERDFTDAISGMPQKNRDTAMLHFYTSMQKRMNGTKLDMPSPTVAEQQRDNTRAIQPARSGEMEMER